MGFLNKLFGEKKSASAPSPVSEIARIISGGDAVVMKEIKDLTEDTKGYFAAHKDRYNERGIDAFDSGRSNELLWLGMVDILAGNHYVCERDCGDEKEDFVYFLGSLKGVSGEKLPLDPEELDEDGELEEWCGIISASWESAGYHVGCIDIESDSYVLFPAKTAELDELRGLAEQMGYRIADQK